MGHKFNILTVILLKANIYFDTMLYRYGISIICFQQTIFFWRPACNSAPMRNFFCFRVFLFVHSTNKGPLHTCQNSTTDLNKSGVIQFKSYKKELMNFFFKLNNSYIYFVLESILSKPIEKKKNDPVTSS